MNRPVVIFSLLLLAMTGLAGCQTEQPMDPGLPIGAMDARKLGYSVLWAADLDLPDGHQVSHVAALDDLLVIVESPSNLVTALSIRDGTVRWRQKVGSHLERLFEPVRYGDRILINSETRLFLLSALTEQIDEEHELEAAVRNSPAIVGDYAIFGAENGLVFWHDLRTGYSRWRQQLSGRVIVRPVASGAGVFVADGNGRFAMYTASGGELLWQGRAFDRITAQPVATAGDVLVASEDHCLYALHALSGKDHWIYRVTEPLIDDPILIGATAYLPSPQRGLIAIDTANGADLWTMEDPARPIVQLGDMVLMNTGSSLVLVEVRTGRQMVEVPVYPLQRVLPGPDQSLVLVSRSGGLVRLDPLR